MYLLADYRTLLLDNPTTLMASLSASLPKPVAGNPNSSPLLTDIIQSLRLRSNIRCCSRHESRLSRRFPRILMCSDQTATYTDWSCRSSDIPVLSSYEVVGRLKRARESLTGGQQFLAMYSSVVGGITTDPEAMVVPLDDHMVHRGHGVFDTAIIIDGFLYELDQHLDRIIRSASMAKIVLPFDRETIRRILIQTVSVSRCRDGSLRYWLSAGPGDFLLSPSHCPTAALYAIVIKKDADINPKGVKVVTSSVPIKPPEFATMKSVNYLPNVLSQMEAEANGGYAGIWLDCEGFVAEGPNMNVAFVVNGGKELLMPRFDNILSGCTAKRTLILAEQLVSEGMLRDVRVCDVTVEDGKKADEMMLLGSGVLIRPVIQWDEQIIGDGNEGPITKALLDLLVEDMRSGPHSVRVSVPY